MKLVDDLKTDGATTEGNVAVDISYDIVRHVSAQLYTSPRKAIEELVCNAYDAGATECHLRLPESSAAPLRVLDNGKSMNLHGLQDLWRVARSPKLTKNDAPRIANGRLQIGKFGVGKLAAFALGQRLTHVACVGDIVRIVSVGQDQIKDAPGGKAPTFDVFKLSLAKAKKVLDQTLDVATLAQLQL